MGRSFYPHSGDGNPPTMTVRQLVAELAALPDQDAPVIFRSPFTNAAYGPLQAYSVERARPLAILARTEHHPARMVTDQETGEAYEEEAWDHVFHPWTGVVIE